MRILWFENVNMQDVDKVGAKNASLGEMISTLYHKGVKVPGGFATTALSYREFLESNNLTSHINDLMLSLDIDNVISLAKTAQSIQSLMLQAKFSEEFNNDIESAYKKLIERYGDSVSLAVRSSATAEDLPNASFAGQQDTYLNIYGIENLKLAIKQVFASLYNDRAISYRIHNGFQHDLINMSAGVQKMVRSDISSSGVMFTIDTESGCDKIVFLTSSYGLGECIVQGMVNPDEFYIYKDNLSNNKIAIIRKELGSKTMKMEFSKSHVPGKSINTISVPLHERQAFSISDIDATQLAKIAVVIEEHYQCNMDIEWAKDGIDGSLYILQARPETVQSRKHSKQVRYMINGDKHVITTGRAIGQKAGAGKVKIIANHTEMHQLSPGDILVTDMTDPDWEPIMKIASAIITNRGGRTCHAAIIARELGIPAIVGCENATRILIQEQEVTVSCCEGDTGYVYKGILYIDVIEFDIENMPELPVNIMMNVANPELAYTFSQTPNCGVGLARLEFIINRKIGIHPNAVLEYEKLPLTIQNTIKEKISGYESPVEFYVHKLAEGIATIASAFFPKKVIVRLSDFKSNEYSNLIAGKFYEPTEENPMLGFRGASRYISEKFHMCFVLECDAIKRAVNDMGFDNIAIMVPFVRTVDEAKQVTSILKNNQLGRDKITTYMMCEIPANALLANEFLEYFDGFSIGSNDLTQLTLGIDRDANGSISMAFDERNDAVKYLITLAINACKSQDKYIGICGQGPSDHPEFAQWLIEQQIESISLNPDTVVDTWVWLSKNNIL